MKNKGYLALVTAALALLAATSVRADIPAITVGLDYAGVSPGTTIHIHNDNPSEDATVWAGAYRHYIEDPIPAILNASEDPTEMFCLDLASNVEGTPAGQYTDYTLVRPEDAPQTVVGTPDHFPMGETRALWLRALAAREWEGLDLATTTGSAWGTTTEAQRYTGMQLAIWEIVYEDNHSTDPAYVPTAWSVTDGDFRTTTTSAAATYANLMLQNLVNYVASLGTNGLESAAAPQYLGALVHDTRQDMLVRTFSQVPEPSAAALAGLAFLGLVTRRRKRRS
jgi:hypothetical protein